MLFFFSIGFFCSIKIEGVVLNIDIKNLFYGLLDRLDSRVAEFNNLTRISQDDVIVIPVKVRFFVLGLVLAKLMLSNQGTFL